MYEPEPPPVQVVSRQSPSHSPPSLLSAWFRKATLRRAMLALTVAWIAAMILFGGFLFASAISGAHFNYEERFVYEKHIPAMTPMGEWWATTFVTAVTGGFCCPTLPYGIALWVLWMSSLAADQ